MGIPLWRFVGTLPKIPQLSYLNLRLKGRRVSNSATSGSIVDFGYYPKLLQLCIEGDAWSGISDVFTGKTNSLIMCCLKGPIIITTRLRMFFDRIAAGLRYLFCHSTHLVGKLETHFPELRHLSVHKVMAASPVFPFVNCERLTSLAIEGEDVDTATSKFNGLLQDALQCTGTTLKGLTLRSGCFRLLNPTSIHAILRNCQLNHLLLDGAICADDRDWTILFRTMDFHIVASVPSWAAGQVSLSASNLMRSKANSFRTIQSCDKQTNSTKAYWKSRKTAENEIDCILWFSLRDATAVSSNAVSFSPHFNSRVFASTLSSN